MFERLYDFVQDAQKKNITQLAFIYCKFRMLKWWSPFSVVVLLFSVLDEVLAADRI